MQGIIDRVVTARGFGFIRATDGRQIFFHRISLLGVDFQTLRAGQAVDFDLQHGEMELYHGQKGLRAASVRLQSGPTIPYFGAPTNRARL